MRAEEQSALGWLMSVVFLLEVEGGRVDAVAQSCVFLGAVFKHVAQVSATLRAHDLHTSHAMALVHHAMNIAVFCHVRERWPARSTLKLLVRLEEGNPTHHAREGAIFFDIHILASPGTLSTCTGSSQQF